MTTYYRGINYCSGPERVAGDSYLKRNTDCKVKTMPWTFMPKITTNRELAAIYCPQSPTTSRLTTCHYVIHPTAKSNTLCTYSTGLTPVEVVDIRPTDDRKQLRNTLTIINVKPVGNEKTTDDGSKKKLSTSANACTQSDRGRSREKKTNQNLKDRRRNRSNGIDIKLSTNKTKISREKVEPMPDSSIKKKRESKRTQLRDKSSERGHTEKALIAPRPPATEKMPLTQYRRSDSQVTNEHKILGEISSCNTQLLAPKPPNKPKELGKQTKIFERRYMLANSATIINALKENEQTKLINATDVNIGGGDTAILKYSVDKIEETNRDATTAHNEAENKYRNDGITYHDDDDDIIFGWKREFPVREMKVIKPKVLNSALPSPKFYQSTEPVDIIRYWQMKRVELNMEIELMA